MAVVSVVFGLLFWAALYFSRKRIVVLKRSHGTDQVTLQLSRIADALERIANHPADRAIAAASRRQFQAQSPRSESREVFRTPAAGGLRSYGEAEELRRQKR